MEKIKNLKFKIKKLVSPGLQVVSCGLQIPGYGLRVMILLLLSLFHSSLIPHPLSLIPPYAYATSQSVSFTLEDRDRLIRLETTLKEFKESVDRRFDGVDKRFESVDKRFEDINNRIDDLFVFLWIITTIFTSITIATISFAIWDRRTMIRPFETKVREIEAIQEIDRSKIEKLILSLREIAKNDEKIEGILKRLNLL